MLRDKLSHRRRKCPSRDRLELGPDGRSGLESEGGSSVAGGSFLTHADSHVGSFLSVINERVLQSFPWDTTPHLSRFIEPSSRRILINIQLWCITGPESIHTHSQRRVRSFT
ncbi:hypothetical protein RRG08_019380 [Elysia crispata]|uniref:Uncharacterized protein n=1 Tax=Elysia crispata TaxID=231223 RepID=A0AAE0XSZ6_9GAST|nr:hypothetical protein RRG08_019380 [Elysia crispata]